VWGRMERGRGRREDGGGRHIAVGSRYNKEKLVEGRGRGVFLRAKPFDRHSQSEKRKSPFPGGFLVPG